MPPEAFMPMPRNIAISENSDREAFIPSAPWQSAQTLHYA
jgi:hypothetical protein